jgi:hypothetical protein
LNLQRWKLRPEHLEEFVELWAEYDDGSGTIDPQNLEAMLLRCAVVGVVGWLPEVQQHCKCPWRCA